MQNVIERFIRKTGIAFKFRSLLKPVYQRITNSTKASTPIFLMGCGRSGTNIMVQQLDRFWDITLYNETNQAAFEKWRLRGFDCIQGLIDDSVARSVVFKPINDSYRMKVISEVFPNAKFIFQFRHYNDVVNSIVRGPFGARKELVAHWMENGFEEFSNYPPSDAAQAQLRELYRDDMNAESGSALYWLLENRFLFDQKLENDSHVLMVNYERMVTDPETTFRKVCQFLDITYSAKALRGIHASSVNKNYTPDISNDVRQACDAMWAKLLSVSE